MVDEVWPLNEQYAESYARQRQQRADRFAPRRREQPAPQPAVTSAPPADDGRTLWLKISALEDARCEILREALDAHPGNQKVIVYVVSTKQRLAWQKGADIDAVAADLAPLIGSQNIAIR